MVDLFVITNTDDFCQKEKKMLILLMVLAMALDSFKVIYRLQGTQITQLPKVHSSGQQVTASLHSKRFSNPSSTTLPILGTINSYDLAAFTTSLLPLSFKALNVFP